MYSIVFKWVATFFKMWKTNCSVYLTEWDKTFKSEESCVPAGERSPLQSASSVWPGRSGAAQRWLAWCSAWPPAPAALPENKNTDQGEATTEQDTGTQTDICPFTRTMARQTTKWQTHTSEVKSQMTSQKQSQTGTSSQKCAITTHTHAQSMPTPPTPPPRGMQKERKTTREKTEQAMSV